MGVAFNIMTCVEMAVDAVEIGTLLLLCIIEVCILPFLGQFRGKQILVALETTAVIDMSACTISL